jgi:hydrophobic/amphiphilic exporter-1 (mainly G- bacteria), HAE1 family
MMALILSENGEQPLLAARKGSREIGFTIVSMTLSLAAVFIPVLFMGGVLGRLFKEFAVTISVAIFISGVVSVTLTPMLCSRFLKGGHEHSRNWFYRITDGFFVGMLRVYDATLRWVLRFRPLTMAFSAAVLATTEAAQGTSYLQMVETQRYFAEIVAADPSVDSLVSSVGGATSATLGGPNYGQLVVHLKPRAERKFGVDRIIDDIDDLRPKLAAIPGMNVYLQNPPTIRIGGQVTKSLYQFTLASPDQDELYTSAETLFDQVRQIDGIQDVATDLAINAAQVTVKNDRDKSAAMQINAQQIENALYDAFGPRWVSTIYGAANEYKVLLMLQPEYQADPRALSLLHFKATNSKLIPLDTLATVVDESGPQAINHFGQLPAVAISFNLVPGAALGRVVEEIQRIADQHLPSTVSTRWPRNARAGLLPAIPASVGRRAWLMGIHAIDLTRESRTKRAAVAARPSSPVFC